MDVRSLICLSNSDEARSASSDSKDSIWLAKKEYVKAINNKLIFTKNNCFAIDSLKVCQEAYEDLLANLIDVNKVIEQAENDSLEINLQYPFPTTYSASHTSYIFTKHNTTNNLNILSPRLKASSEDGGTTERNVLLTSMAANSHCYFQSGAVNIKSITHVNISIFFWSFMIYDEVWGHHNGANGLGVIGENNGNYEYDWLYALDNHTGKFNWEFRNVSSSTDGVSINYNFFGKKVNR